MPAVFSPLCVASSVKSFLFGHHLVSKIVLIQTFS